MGTLLSDEGIRDAIRSGRLDVQPLPLSGDDAIDFAKDAAIQPSSLDLHVGAIFVPPEDKPDPARPLPALPRRLGYDVLPGRSVLVETAERLRLGPSIAAFGFPPASLATQGILMTNPGHVDPGYEGTMTFTLINMGREPHQVNAGEPIVSLLLFDLERDAVADYAKRRGGRVAPPDHAKTLAKLSPDFGSFHSRMGAAAQEVVKDLAHRLDTAKLWVPAVSGAVAGLLTAVVIWFTGLISDIEDVVVEDELAPLRADVRELRRELDILRASGDAVQLDDRLDELQRRIDELGEASR